MGNTDKINSISTKVKEFNRTLTTSNEPEKVPISEVKYFNPQPSMVASGLCSYKFIINTAVNRIPGMKRKQTFNYNSQDSEYIVNVYLWF